MEGLDKKELAKSRKELIKLHKRVIETHLRVRQVHIRTRKKFFELYDLSIDEDNINKVFFKPIRVFVYALITKKIHLIQDIYPEDRHLLNH